jgi:hypothetical protein
MTNARSGRLALLGAAACMVAMPVTLAAAPADATPAHDVLLPEPGTSPSQYAQTAFDAWVRADRIELEKRGTPEVADMLEARPWTWDDEWDEQNDCEGAAGSTYCTWTGTSAHVTLRVASEQAAAGEPHAVIEAVLEPVPGEAIALWPYTTQQEADNSQAQVDQGHSPWQLYPDTVATIYAQNELGWDDAKAESPSSDSILLTDVPTGAQVEVTMDQPARTGEAGIWAVTSLRSISGG